MRCVYLFGECGRRGLPRRKIDGDRLFPSGPCPLASGEKQQSQENSFSLSSAVLTGRLAARLSGSMNYLPVETHTVLSPGFRNVVPAREVGVKSNCGYQWSRIFCVHHSVGNFLTLMRFPLHARASSLHVCQSPMGYPDWLRVSEGILVPFSFVPFFL